MRHQLRLRVILPVAVLGLLGAGFGAFAYGQPPEASTAPVAPGAPAQPAQPKKAAKGKPAAAKKAAPAKKARRSGSPERSALARALSREGAVVVVFYTPRSDVDNAAIREARAGALELGAGFVAVNVGRNGAVEELADEYRVSQAPAVLVFRRGPRVVTRLDGYADRETVAQAVADALR